jgi:prophage tail gpP-like protein
MPTTINSPGSPIVVRFPTDDEIAVIVANGVQYQDWETVMVQLRWLSEYDYCRFTCAERREDLVPYWQKWQLKPCDEIIVNLAGKLAMTGVLIERQVGYDPDNHGIQLLGIGDSIYGYKSSVNTTTGSFDDMSFEQIARKVLEPYGTVKTIGELNALKFDKVQANPGESIWQFLENLARPRGIIMASDKDGAFLFIGMRHADTIATLKEGVNIKSMNFTVNINEQWAVYKTIGQNAGGSNGIMGAQASEQESLPVGGTGCKNSILITVAEQPVKGQGELNDRARNEAKWKEGARVRATVVVQGWTFNGTNIWYPGAGVWIDSAMCPIDQKMCIERVTFQQSRQAGTTTTLDCCLPWMLNDTDIGLGHHVQPAPGAAATPEQQKANAPQS